jgi:putative tricarboxylic transport membrane protein
LGTVLAALNPVIDFKKITRGYECLISIFLFGGAVGAFFTAREFPDASGIFPQMVTVLGIFLTAVLVIKSSMKAGTIPERDPFFIHIPKFAISCSMMLAYLFSINFVGYFTSTAMFIPALAYMLSYKNTKASLYLSVGFVAAIYVIFVVIFKTTLPPELILQWVLGYD